MTEAARKKVLVVDDSAFNRRTLANFITSEIPNCDVIVARDGEEALHLYQSEDPAVVTLDLEMPRMDGFTFLRLALAHKPRPILVVSAKNDERSLLKALELGALDYIAKPTQQASLKLVEIQKEYIEKLKLALGLEVQSIARRSQILLQRLQKPQTISKVGVSNAEVTRLVIIGASTGGPAAIQSVLSQIQPKRNLAVVVAQHMPEGFTAAFSARLNQAAPFEVTEVSSVVPLTGHSVFVAKGGRNLVITEQNERYFVASMPPNANDRFVPSVDVLMKSASEAFARRMMGVVLTGMGTDGTEGCRALKARKMRVIVESEQTAIVYGMPRSVYENGLADKKLPLDQIPDEINSWVLGIR